jgi:hypothetical protein
MATLPALTEQERSILRTISSNNPLRVVEPSTHGRLVLYDLIGETPRGWIVTQRGMEAIDRAPIRNGPVSKLARGFSTAKWIVAVAATLERIADVLPSA